MTPQQFANTTIGSDYLQTGERYPIDSLLDYLIGLNRFKEKHKVDQLWYDRYDHEIEATMLILKELTK